MRNIGLLTYHWVANFGANLQTLSTISYLRNNNYNPIIINWIPERLSQFYQKTTIDAQLKAHEQFQSNYGQITPRCVSNDDVVKVIKDFNIEFVIIGSDAVLTYTPILDRFRLTRKGFRYIKPFEDSDFPNPYWAEFLDSIDVPTAFMSVSAQNTKYSHIKFHKQEFARKIGQLSYLSVRDTWTSNMIQYLTKGEIVPTITPDPVFAFNQNLDDKLTLNKAVLQKKYHLPENYIIISLFTELFEKEWIDKLVDLFHEKGIATVSIPKSNKTTYRPNVDINIELPLPPIDWYYLIKYSQGYIGELMHPVLVSLHNSVPVFSIDTYGFTCFRKVNESSSKILHILDKFHLLENVYHVKSGKNKPTPQLVFDKIINFDRDDCAKVAARCLEEYNVMMKTILKKL